MSSHAHSDSSKTLVIIAHPHLADGSPQQSRVNARWARELAAHPAEFDVRDLYALYPAGRLGAADIAAEQAALVEHETIIFQFPIYWYSCPALLRTWLDEVYAFGWAYGEDEAVPGTSGRMLAGKRFACAVSAADTPESYAASGKLGFTMEQMLTPFYATANYVGAVQVPSFTFYRAEEATDDAVDASAADYVSWLRALTA